MIQKRYQYQAKESVKWTPWFDYKENGSIEEVKFLNTNKETKFQVKGKLLNEYRLQ